MKRIILALFILFSFQLSIAQNSNEKLSINFNDETLENALKSIESSTPYKFYFDPTWIRSNNKLITGTYTDIKIDDLLEKLLNKTELNFIVIKNKVILTLNNTIHDDLPANYFADTPVTNDRNNGENNSNNPVFYQQYDTLNNYSVTKKASIVFIGKENKEVTKKNFVVSGTIKNEETGKPEANIFIKVKNKNISTSSNPDGYYSLQLPRGINIIEIKSLSHKEIVKTLMVYEDGVFDVNINEKSNQLDEIVIKKKGKKTIETTVSGLVSIDIEGIKNVPLILGERDILKVATTFPGVKTTGEGSAGFNVRGGKDDQNLILLDNAVLYNPQHFLGFFSAINPYTAKKADIYKGSIPADFGGRLSSVFDITTKNGNLEKFSGEGAVGPITSNLTISTPIKKNKSSIIFGVRATYSDWILKSLDDENLKNSQAGFYDGILKYNNNINKNNSIEATLYYSHDRFSLSSDSIYKYSNRLASVKWDHTFNEKSKGALIFTNSEYKFNIDYNTENINSFDFGYKVNESQLQLKMNYQLNKKHNLSYGVASKLYNISPGYQHPTNPEATLVPIEIAKERALESAIYLADSYKLSDKLLIDLGLRYSFYASLGPSDVNKYQPGLPLSDETLIGTEKYSNNEVIKTYGGLEPRLAARYFITEDLSVKAGYDFTRQYIHLLSSNVTQSPTDTWKLSDSNVAPQSAQQVSLGLFKTLKDEEYEISLEGYYKTSKNILDYKVGAQLLLNQKVETELLQGEGKAYGIELLLKKTTGRLNGWVGYTYSKSLIKLDSKFSSETVNNGNFFPSNFDKPHDLSAILNYKFTKRYSLSTNFLYQTGRPITYPIGTFNYGNAEYTLYSDRNAYRIPDYIRLDIGINIEGNHKIKKLAHSFWNISIYNVLGRNNPYSIYFVTDKNGSVKGYKSSIFSIPVPSITYNFKF
ncbi:MULTISPECIES: TonB-dependent receptor [unclassified Flavobacterium]|uniref:TonB-dependent receptor n=1 Tax=unclassified Flavobacterium TaxID=196869 RepID=UPI000F0BFD43|nr:MULTISPECIES: TonB-dependent receptor [unclassified Flavobacterium]AYN02759.1 TonB-dependent receptor [Flavobacterium sp. 140616W15]MCD0472966.1 TonB-dependent receptor [Flavobacterium sp. EDS]